MNKYTKIFNENKKGNGLKAIQKAINKVDIELRNEKEIDKEMVMEFYEYFCKIYNDDIICQLEDIQNSDKLPYVICLGSKLIDEENYETGEETYNKLSEHSKKIIDKMEKYLLSRNTDIHVVIISDLLGDHEEIIIEKNIPKKEKKNIKMQIRHYIALAISGGFGGIIIRKNIFSQTQYVEAFNIVNHEITIIPSEMLQLSSIVAPMSYLQTIGNKNIFVTSKLNFDE